MPFKLYDKSNTVEMPKTKNYEEMITLSERQLLGISFVRVDFYEVDGKIYIGGKNFFHVVVLNNFDRMNGMENMEIY